MIGAMWRGVLVFVTACGRIGFDPPMIDASVPTDAVVWLQMESDPNVRIVDSARGHAVECTATCPAPVSGQHGSGFRFTGQQLRIPFTMDLVANTGFTVAAWVLVDQAPVPGDYACVIGKPLGGADFDSVALCLDSTQRLYTYTASSPTVDHNLYAGVVSLGVWHHVAATWDKATGLQTIYLDRQVSASDTTGVAFDGNSLMVAADNTTPAYFWHGSLDDVVFYDRALAQDEIDLLGAL
jgi:hypothetical protein